MTIFWPTQKKYLLRCKKTRSNSVHAHYNKGMNTKRKPMSFALAGEVVSDAAHAKRILVAAIHKDKAWLVPQAASVLSKFRANAQRTGNIMIGAAGFGQAQNTDVGSGLSQVRLTVPATLSGRCSNGNEHGRGSVVHAVEAHEVGVFGGRKSLEFADYSVALCAKTHGAHGAGWSMATDRDVSCPACLKKYHADKTA